MMPGTIAERHADSVTVEATTRTEDLTGAERTVALYASDMPNGRRHYTKEQFHAWIVQGAERLGQAEMRRLALYLRGWQLLNMSNLVTAQVQARHEQRFPRRFRLVRAGQGAALSISVDGMSAEALTRNSAVGLDGDCPCRGTGGIMMWGTDPDASYKQLCPIHRRAEIDAHRRTLLASR